MITLVCSLILSQCPQSGETLDEAGFAYALAQERLKQGRLKEGMEDLRTLTRKAPWFALPRWSLARTEESRGAWTQAYLEYKRLLLAPIEDEDRRDARRHLRELEAKAPLLKLYADAERATLDGDWRLVLAKAEQVAQEKPTFSLAHRLVGIALLALGNEDKAAAAFASYLEVDPETPERAEIDEFLSSYRAAAKVAP